VHKHPHNRWSLDNAGFDRDSGGSAAIGKRESCGSGASFDPGSGEAALRRFANRESCE